MKIAATARPARRRVPVLATLTLATVAIAMLASVAVTAMMRERTLYERVADLGPERAIAPLTSLAVDYKACGETVSGSTLSTAACAGRSRNVLAGEELVALAAEIHARIEEGPDADALQAQAMLDLHGVGDGRPRPDAAIALLDSALPLTSDSAAVMVDLAAAFLVRAGESKSPADLRQAMDWSMRALTAKPGYEPALFNRALALDAFTADSGAAKAWREFIDSEPGSWWASLLPNRIEPWRREAVSRLRAMQRPPTVVAPGADASDAELAAFATAHPQAARETGWNVLLPEWGTATLDGDRARAEKALRRAEIFGAALVRRGGDATLDHQVRHVRTAAATATGTRAAAEAHRLHGKLAAARGGMDEVRGGALLDSLAALDLSAPQTIWVALARAGINIDRGNLSAAERLLESIGQTIDIVKYSAAAGQHEMLRGTLLARQGEFGAAPIAYLKAETAFARVSEGPNRGRVGAYLSDTHRIAGNSAEADAWLLRALVTLRQFGPSWQRHDLMRQAAAAAHHDGLQHAMRDLAAEDVAVATDYGNPAYLAEARVNRAMLLASSGDHEAALRELPQALRIVRNPSPFVRRFFASSEAYVRAQVELEKAPRSSLAWSDSLISDRSRAIWPMRGFALRAHALVGIGDIAGARSALDSVFAALELGRKKGGGAGDREVVEGDVGAAVERLVVRLVQAGRNREALEWLGRRDAAFSSVHMPDTRLPARVPDGRVVVRPLVVGDTLLVWTLKGSSLALTRSTISSSRLTATIDTVDTWLSRGWNADAQLTRLYGLLIRPIEARLGTDTELVFVTDGDLAGLPFSALLAPDGKPLVYRHAFARALSVAAAAADRDTTLPDSAAFLAPAYVASAGLDPLPHAGEEVRAASPEYPVRRMLDSASAPSAFMDALMRYGLVHFAGHAVVDNLRPERSYLALSPGTPRSRLTAAGIDSLRLGGLRLVVLSACSSLGGSRGSSGFTGLSGAFLGAGAQGVVGSLWKVDDRATQSLMTAFHQHYRRTGDPVRALRQAQIEMLESNDAVQKRPSTWAAFQFVGR
ncbi:MAG TPA: CHAT domain-containing tetratricopeptide repeat protein [Longimicrobium sp.]|nr:CHAT domain-containing tetratricopeptide repeat protein [Longimicrobium sp.]